LISNLGKDSQMVDNSVGLEVDQPTDNIVIKPAVGCHYFPPGPQLPAQPKSITTPWPVPNYTAW